MRMIMMALILWVAAPPTGPASGAMEFERFRQSKLLEIEEHRKAVQKDPLDAVEYFHLGLAYMAVGRHREEIEAYREALRLYSNYAAAHYNLAMAYDLIQEGLLAIHHTKEAERLYERQKKDGRVRQMRRQLNLFYQKYGYDREKKAGER